MKLLWIIAALLAFGALSCSKPQAATGPKIGDSAPSFTITDSQGKAQSLSDYQGKYVVLEWFNDGCPYVKKHYNSGNMQGLQKKYIDNGVAWLTVLSSSQGKQGHMDAQKINALLSQWNSKPTAVLLDPNGELGLKYAAKTTPHMYVINPQGNLIYMGAIDSVSSADPADIPGATNYLALALDEAQAGKALSQPATQPYGCSVKY